MRSRLMTCLVSVAGFCGGGCDDTSQRNSPATSSPAQASSQVQQGGSSSASAAVVAEDQNQSLTSDEVNELARLRTEIATLKKKVDAERLAQESLKAGLSLLAEDKVRNRLFEKASAGSLNNPSLPADIKSLIDAQAGWFRFASEKLEQGADWAFENAAPQSESDQQWAMMTNKVDSASLRRARRFRDHLQAVSTSAASSAELKGRYEKAIDQLSREFGGDPELTVATILPAVPGNAEAYHWLSDTLRHFDVKPAQKKTDGGLPLVTTKTIPTSRLKLPPSIGHEPVIAPEGAPDAGVVIDAVVGQAKFNNGRLPVLLELENSGGYYGAVVWLSPDTGQPQFGPFSFRFALCDAFVFKNFQSGTRTLTVSILAPDSLKGFPRALPEPPRNVTRLATFNSVVGARTSEVQVIRVRWEDDPSPQNGGRIGFEGGQLKYKR